MMPQIDYADFLSGSWRTLTFEYFREGITVHWLIKGGTDAPSLALLKYEAGAKVPYHRHRGLETILVLEGAQSDEHGTYEVGALVCNAVGSEHRVWSETGCVVLISWALPVEILES